MADPEFDREAVGVNAKRAWTDSEGFSGVARFVGTMSVTDATPERGMCSAGIVRAGIPGAWRAGSPTSGASATTPLSTESSSAGPVGPDTPAPSSSPSSAGPVDTAEHPWHCRTPHSPDTTATPEPLVTASTAHAADIPETSDIPSPAGTGIPSTWAPILDARTAPPSSSGAHEDTLTTWDTTRLGASPSQELSTEGTNPHAADAGEPEPLAFNSEAFERTMTPALLEELR